MSSEITVLPFLRPSPVLMFSSLPCPSPVLMLSSLPSLSVSCSHALLSSLSVLFSCSPLFPVHPLFSCLPLFAVCPVLMPSSLPCPSCSHALLSSLSVLFSCPPLFPSSLPVAPCPPDLAHQAVYTAAVPFTNISCPVPFHSLIFPVLCCSIH